MSKALLSLTLAAALMFAAGLPVAAQQPDASGDKAFASLDSDKDGKLTQAEFGKLFEMEGKTATDQEKQNEFKAWDADADGSISKTEFSANYSAGQPEPQPQPKQ